MKRSTGFHMKEDMNGIVVMTVMVGLVTGLPIRRTSIMRTTAILTLTALLAGCVSVRYDGDEYAPTEAITEYTSLDDIDRAHEVIGTLDVRGDKTKMTQAQVRDRAAKEACKRGADGMVVIVDELRSTKRSNPALDSRQRDSLPPEFGEPERDETWLVRATLIRYTN